MHNDVGIFAVGGRQNQTVRVAFLREADDIGGVAVGQHAVGDDEVDRKARQKGHGLALVAHGTKDFERSVTRNVHTMNLAPVRVRFDDQNGVSLCFAGRVAEGAHL